MKWIGISGGWRRTNEKVESDVRGAVREIMERGDGIVSGGALGVDSIALDEAMKYNPKADRIKIFLPATLERYAAHYRKRAAEGVITNEQAEELISQLTRLKKVNSDAIIENQENEVIDKENYYKRNSDVAAASGELIAFRIKTETSEGMGTHDTVLKAEEKGIPVKVYNYNLTQ
jgi:predicted AlkP superfamily phosphohydrolase/phosphomutase